MYRSAREMMRKGGPAAAPKGSARDRDNNKAKKKLLKDRFKRELRAERKAIQKGRDPEKAKARALEKYEKELHAERKRRASLQPVAYCHRNHEPEEVELGGDASCINRMYAEDPTQNICGPCGCSGCPLLTARDLPLEFFQRQS